MRRLATLTVALLLLAATAVIGGVNLRNGNFYISYTDVEFEGGGPEIGRTYNSKSVHEGIFGFGWGSPYEVYLEESVGGSVIVREWGGGASRVYWPADVDQADIDAALETIVEAARPDFRNPTQLVAYRDSISKSQEIYSKEWRRLIKKGRIKQPDLPVGTRLYDKVVGSHIIRIADGYSREAWDGSVYNFDRNGKLARITDKNKDYVALTYDARGHLSSIVDQGGRGVDFNINDKGLVTAITMRGDGRQAQYRYDDVGNLVWSRDIGGNEYTHAYDVQHNMTRIGYTDGTSMTITYSGRAEVSSVKDRQGLITYYDLTQSDEANGRVVWQTVVTKVAATGDTLARDRYEWSVATNARGERWTQQYLIETDSSRRVFVYNECCANTLRKEESRAVGKASRRDARSWSTPHVTEFSWNENEQLVKATTSKGESAVFSYDADERLTQVITATDTLTLTYDAQGKRTRVTSSSGRDAVAALQQIAALVESTPLYYQIKDE